MALPLFYASEEDFQRFRATLKLQACPHCRKTGTLNCHGHLRGYPEEGGNTPVFRGRRLFCSNRRRRRPGCGRTVGLWLSHVLPNFILTLQTLWLFLAGVLAGLTKADAFRRTECPMHPTTAYRHFQRAASAQSRLRARLCRRVRPPEASGAVSPLVATLAHLQAAFPRARCPPTEYQLHFQTPFPA